MMMKKKMLIRSLNIKKDKFIPTSIKIFSGAHDIENNIQKDRYSLFGFLKPKKSNKKL